MKTLEIVIPSELCRALAKQRKPRDLACPAKVRISFYREGAKNAEIIYSISN